MRLTCLFGILPGRWTGKEKPWGKMGTTVSANAVISGGQRNSHTVYLLNFNTSSDITTASGSNDVLGVSAALDHRSKDARFSMGVHCKLLPYQIRYRRGSFTVQILPPNAPRFMMKQVISTGANITPLGGLILESFVWLPTPVESKTTLSPPTCE